jgi:dTDP-4-dehydrorhamnose 3,5-epimerase
MFERLDIPDVFLFTPKRIGDSRGHFVETFRQALLDPMTGPLTWVQDNQSRTTEVGVVRGLHCQIPPFAQDKLVRCVRGAVLDVAVDVRVGSPTFGRHVAAELTEDNGVQIFVPKGFLHGFITRAPNTEVAYKVTNYYNAACDKGVRYDDPALAIAWDAPAAGVIVSDKDANLPLLQDFATYFRYP